MSLREKRAKDEPWPLQDAKARLSEVVDTALKDGPQIITRRGEHTAVLLAYDEYIRLSQRNTTLADVFRRAPGELPYVRDTRPVLPIDLE